jgi:very-short-patch-repair endonuclease
MSEIFDIIAAVNRLKEQVIALSKRVDFICKYPSLIANVRYVNEATARKMLNVSKQTLWRLRANNEITFIKFRRRLLYSIDSLEAFLKKRSRSSFPDI